MILARSARGLPATDLVRVQGAAEFRVRKARRTPRNSARMSVRVYAVDRSELPPFEMPDRFRHDITYFVTSPGEAGAPETLPDGQWWVRLADAREMFDAGTIRIVSPLDSNSSAEIELSEEQENWLQWMIENQIELVRLA
jgi:hypothetical protein